MDLQGHDRQAVQIRSKLGVSNHHELLQLAIENGWIEPHRQVGSVGSWYILNEPVKAAMAISEGAAHDSVISCLETSATMSENAGTKIDPADTAASSQADTAPGHFANLVKANRSRVAQHTQKPKIRWQEALGQEPYYRRSTVDLAILTPRELELFSLLAHGLTLKEAAAQAIKRDGKQSSWYTSADYERRIYKKLGLANREELVKAGIDADVVKLAQGPQLQDLIDACEPLGPRHYQVLERIALGDTDKQAGEALGISWHTVHTYKKEIYAAFGINNSADATRIYVTLKLEADQWMQEKKATGKADSETIQPLKVAPAKPNDNGAERSVTPQPTVKSQVLIKPTFQERPPVAIDFTGAEEVAKSLRARLERMASSTHESPATVPAIAPKPEVENQTDTGKEVFNRLLASLPAQRFR